MKKPVIDFYPSREALDARFAVPTPTSLPMTPTYSYSTPGSVSGMFSPQQPFNGMQPISMGSPVFTELHSPRSPLVPRFGMMGIGAPQGSEAMRTADVMQWEAHAPVAARETLPPPRYQHSRQDEAGSCCQGPASPQSETTYPTYMPPSQDGHTVQEAQTSFNGATPTVSMASQGPVPQPTTPFDFNKLANDYFQYQLPSAICQTCGLSGCTCRSCPPVMQSFSNGSWAQCCGRKHARTANYVPPNTAAQFQQPTTTLASQHPSTLVSQPNPHDGSGFAAARASDCCQAPKRTYEPETRPPPSSEQSPSQSLPDFSEFDPGADFAIPGVTDNLDLSEFLMADLDRPGLQPEGGGCCAGSAED
ncbi:hypothetical protein Tdes44962_MAKER03820 [Teratosphaeria destructans]|uniref:Uncharacterized protein n=1 Tax=Teratosphaeria destructans TaxID=418781 RepID=A0A9W7SP24_9PEZI|nr:hypothetical protein Tdes44962_MAKER03820 [Teratosphaeria destructans]